MKLTLDTILVIVSGIASWLTALTGLIFGYKSFQKQQSFRTKDQIVGCSGAGNKDPEEYNR